MEEASLMPSPNNPTRWRQIYIPEELAKDLEDITAQVGLAGIGETATLLIVAGAHAMNEAQQAREAKEPDGSPGPNSISDIPAGPDGPQSEHSS